MPSAAVCGAGLSEGSNAAGNPVGGEGDGENESVKKSKQEWQEKAIFTLVITCLIVVCV